jgi:hypothetical protein
VDILVIGDFHRKNRLLGWELRGLLDRFAVPIDVHIATRDEIMCAQHASSFSFLKSIFSNASSLYKKAYDIHGITMECRRDVQNVQKKSLQ